MNVFAYPLNEHEVNLAELILDYCYSESNAGASLLSLPAAMNLCETNKQDVTLTESCFAACTKVATKHISNQRALTGYKRYKNSRDRLHL